jgi:hypothetical protein
VQLSADTEISSFESDTTSALALVRSSLAAMTRSLKAEIRRPADLQKSLGVDSKLSWQIFNVINEADPLAAAKLIPGTPSVVRLIKAARSRGVSEEQTDTVRRAVAEFNRVVERHAQDRAEFDLMASSAASAPIAAAAEMAFRKAAFRSESHIWGVCADVLGGTTIVRRASDGLTTDEVTLMNRRDCRRLRLDAPMSVFAYRNYGAQGVPEGRVRIPLDQKAADQYGAHILPRFCSQPIPAFRTWLRPDGYTAVDVQSREIGRQHAISLTVGQIYRNCPLAKGINSEPIYQADMRLATPSRVLVSTNLVHRPTLGKVNPELLVFRQTPGDDNIAVAQSAPQVPTRDEIKFLGTGPSAWATPDIDGHDAMVQVAFDEVGWNPAEFDVYRVRIEYPVLHTVVRMQFPVDAF